MHEDFLNQVHMGWCTAFQHSDPTKLITAKFKNLRKVLKQWKRSLSNLNANISNVKLMLQFLNFLEECRDLSLIEWNFRTLLEDMLKQQKAYWKQRSSIKWVTLGDAGTNFFHAHATVKYRRNLITQLTTDSGEVLVQHHDKAQHIWQAFKDRLGTTSFSGVSFDLHSLLDSSVDLSTLSDHFSRLEIDKVVKALPSDKSLGPDGFNTDFVKKCWPIISEDFYTLCSAFYSGNICLQSINGSYITLVRKMLLSRWEITDPSLCSIALSK
jgi:hypothetical protein